MRLLQISDTHFGTERPEVVTQLTAIAAAIKPDTILLCGDITQRARPAQFAAARRFMDAMPQNAQRIVIPGNHDLPLFNPWARFVSPYARYERCFGARETLWRGSGLCVLALDATHPHRHKDGALEPEHLQERLCEARAGCGSGDLLVVAAHQPLWTAWSMDKEQTLIGRAQTAALMAEARVDIVLSGHVHVPLIGTSAISDLQLPWHFVLSGSGTAVSHRTRQGVPNSFNLLSAAPAAPQQVRIERYDYVDGEFRVVTGTKLTRGTGGWSEASAAVVGGC